MSFMPTRRNDGLSDVFEDVFRDGWFQMPSAGSLMKTDIREKDGKYSLDVDLPGFKKEDIKISLMNGNLTIQASHNESQEEKDKKGNIVRQERYSGSCSRSFYVGENVKESDIHASYNNGQLTVELPSEKELETKQQKYIDIQ